MKTTEVISYALSQTMTKELALGTIESGIEIITFEQVIQVIDDYMYYYNNERRQWNKSKMTPVEYRKFLLASYLSTFWGTVQADAGKPKE